MARHLKLYRALWGLSRNPFPDQAIAAAGDQGQPFYERLHPGIASKMARAFIGSDGTQPNVAFLWSMGEGDEARGYGKTRYLLWFADRVNEDLGGTVARLAGRGSGTPALIATYASFSTVDGLSLSNLLFDAVRDLVAVRHDTLNTLRQRALAQGRDADDLYVDTLRLLNKGGEPWSPGLLRKLCDAEPRDWSEYLDNRQEFGQWHRVRYGRQMLRTAVAFLAELGVPRVLVLVDQVEDFAAAVTPSYKLKRDFPRLAELCQSDPLLRGRLTFVLTMHPRAARVVSRYWPEGDLGPVGADGAMENVVRLGPMTRPRFGELVRTYLEAARVAAQPDTLFPFSEEVIDLVHQLDHGRPGYCLRRLFLLIESAAEDGHRAIERDYADEVLADQTSATREH
jgi:hypothetical protein